MQQQRVCNIRGRCEEDSVEYLKMQTQNWGLRQGFGPIFQFPPSCAAGKNTEDTGAETQLAALRTLTLGTGGVVAEGGRSNSR